MKILYSAFIFFTFANTSTALAVDAKCSLQDGKVLTSLKELPAQVLNILDYSKAGIYGIADIGGRFNPTDVILDDSLPMRRLVSGAIGRHCIYLTIEYGGIGHYEKQHEYWNRNGKWVEAQTGIRGPRAPDAPSATR